MTKEQAEKYTSYLKQCSYVSGIDDGLENDGIKTLHNYLDLIRPRELYRFRSCSEQNFDAFFRNQLWLSSASSFNDDYDGLFYCQKEEVLQSLQALFDDNKEYEYLKTFLKLSTEEFSDNLSLILLQTFIKNFSKDDLITISSHIYDNLEYEVYEYIENGADTIQETNYVACLSEDISSPTMWGHYGNNSTGFALSYSFALDDPLRLQLLPVCYSDFRYDGTPLAKYVAKAGLCNAFAKAILGDLGVELGHWMSKQIEIFDFFDYLRVLLFKSDDWKYEKEWRLVSIDTANGYEGKKHFPIIKAPTALFLGRNISDINKKILTSIAQEKGIDIYQMSLDYSSDKYNLIANKCDQ